MRIHVRLRGCGVLDQYVHIRVRVRVRVRASRAFGAMATHGDLIPIINECEFVSLLLSASYYARTRAPLGTSLDTSHIRTPSLYLLPGTKRCRTSSCQARRRRTWTQPCVP